MYLTFHQGDGSSITVEPGLIGGEINALLARHKAKGGHDIQYKIGPDPSSIDSCMIGGMVANNSSGMCCGVSQNVRCLALSSPLSLLHPTCAQLRAPTCRDQSGTCCCVLAGQTFTCC